MRVMQKHIYDLYLLPWFQADSLEMLNTYSQAWQYTRYSAPKHFNGKCLLLRKITLAVSSLKTKYGMWKRYDDSVRMCLMEISVCAIQAFIGCHISHPILLRLCVCLSRAVFSTKRIRSVPGNITLPRIISPSIQPMDQTSTFSL